MKVLFTSLLFVVFCSCLQYKTADERVIELADKYYVHLFGVQPDISHQYISVTDSLWFSHNNPGARKLAESFEDSLYQELIKIDKNEIYKKVNLITYLVLKEDLENAIQFRVCHMHLWNVNPKDGMHQRLIWRLNDQNFENELQKKLAMEQWKKVPQYIQTEISNLKLGIEKGYTMPWVVVPIVINQIERILNSEEASSPFFLPVLKTKDEEFIAGWRTLMNEEVLVALRDYQNFLKNDYLKSARKEVSVLALPNGLECYNAFIRQNTTLKIEADSIYRLGQSLVAANTKEIAELGKELYKTSNTEDIILQNRQAGKNFFNSEQEVLSYIKLILDEAKKQSENWFYEIPEKGIEVKPYSNYEYGGGEIANSPNGGPSIYKVKASYQLKETRADCEILTFHESYPGHHLQMSVADAISVGHPIVKQLEFEAYDEGWAKYAESLAEEMGLYSDITGLIERRSWEGRTMVIDVGVHLYGWTMQDVIDYLAEAGFDKNAGIGAYRRSIFWPAQLTAYGVGREQFRSLRKLSEQQLKEDFNIKEFHSKLLENGSVPLSVLRYSMENWIKEEK